MTAVNVSQSDINLKKIYHLVNAQADLKETKLPRQVTTLERQFGFSSNQTGLIMAANDIGFLVCVLGVSYLAPRMHIPKALGGSALYHFVVVVFLFIVISALQNVHKS